MLRELAIRELAYRALRKLRPVPTVLDPRFPEQTNFILDPARLKALFCTRRAAKSYTAGLYLIKEALENPGCNCLFVGLTRLEAKRIIWKDILKEINRKFDLGITFNDSELTAKLPNGSVIWVTGVDVTEDEMKKLLGAKYRLVCIDEASMYTVDLRTLVYGILKPAVADNRGTICLMGTAGNVTAGLFFDVTRKDGEPKEPGWAVHEWTAFQNPYVVEQWKEELEEIRLLRPLFMTTPLYRQWYLNEWVIDADALVYKFTPDLNLALHLPKDISGWKYILGVDLGHSPDSCGFSIGAYHDLDPNLYIVHAEKHLKMDFTDCAEKIKELETMFDFEVKVADGANKQGLAEMNNRHRTGLIPAEKHGKVEYINLFNGDLLQGLIKVLPSGKPLTEEWKQLVWVTEGGKIVEPRTEHPLIHNDLADPTLYLWRYAYTYLWAEKEKPPEPGSVESWEPDHIRKLQERVRKEQNPNELDLDWDDSWTPEGDGDL